jgi:acetyl-CoA/propionyl-CoA carboxylase biotin carboxyl carrier protein
MRVVHHPAELPVALVSARREAASAFGDDTLFLERFVLNPRHIEVQVLADGYGNVVHLGERECSLQRRHQKVIEEAPSPLLDPTTRARIGAAACDTARSVDYTGAGTVEFIVSADRPDEFFFMEMNTRLQVEHPVTEMVTGIDLVELQVRIAAGEKLPIGQDDITMRGHAIEARVYAEDPARGFLHRRRSARRRARGPGVRGPASRPASSAANTSAKVIAHGDDRPAARSTVRWRPPRCSASPPTSSSCAPARRSGRRRRLTRARPPDSRYVRAAATSWRGGGLQVAALLARTGRRLVGGAVGLATGRAGADDVPAPYW